MFHFVHNNKRLIQLILGLLTLPFAFFGVESYTRSAGGASAAAVVDGVPVTMREYSDETRRQQDRIRQILGPTADMSAFDTPELRLAILESLVSQRLLINEVAQAHLAASKDDVVAGITSAPEFQDNGRFSPERYGAYLRMMGLSDEGNVQKMRLEIPASRLTSAVAGSAIQPRSVAARIAAIEAEKREISEALIPAETFARAAKIDEPAIKAYYEGNLGEFKRPERIRADYVVYSAETLGAASEAPTEAEIRSAYDAKAGEYTVPEQRRASHILLPTKEEAETVLAEVRKNPAQFAEIAKKRSQDTGSAANGGDLGMNPRGGLASKALDDAVFALAPNAVSDVVQTEFGFHIVRLTAVQAGSRKALEDVRKELAAEVAKQKSAKRFAEGAEQFNNLAYEQSDSLKPAAERFKLKIQSTGWFSKQAPQEAGPLGHPKLLAALFSQDAIKQGRNTDAVEVAPGVLVAARVAEHQPEAQRPLEEVKSDIAQKLARREGAAQAKKEGESKLAALAKGGEAGLSWSAVKLVSRQDLQGLPRNAIQRVMAADASKLPAYVGVDRGADGYAIYRIGKVVPADVSASLKETQARLDRDTGAQQLEAYVASLRARSKVELHTQNLEQKPQ